MVGVGMCYQACAHFLCKRSIWKMLPHPGQDPFRETSAVVRLGDLEKQAISSSMFYLFSPNSRNMVSFHMGINGMQKVFFHLQLSSHPSAICALAAGPSVSLHRCYLETLSVTKRRKSSLHSKATLRSKTNSEKRLCLF